jgi:transcriptional regulator with XRE-family HTH domain
MRNTSFMEKMRETLRQLMDREGHNPYDVERRSGVGQTTTFRFLEGLIKNPTFPTVKKWARAYGVTESQLRGEAPISGIDVPDEPKELKDILPPEEYKLLSNIKKMNPKARGTVYELSEMLANSPDENPCLSSGERRKRVISSKNQHLRAGEIYHSGPQQNRLRDTNIATRTGTRA